MSLSICDISLSPLARRTATNKANRFPTKHDLHPCFVSLFSVFAFVFAILLLLFSFVSLRSLGFWLEAFDLSAGVTASPHFLALKKESFLVHHFFFLSCLIRKKTVGRSWSQCGKREKKYSSERKDGGKGKVCLQGLGLVEIFKDRIRIENRRGRGRRRRGQVEIHPGH